MGVNKIGLIKNQMRKEKEKHNTRHLCIVNGSSVVSILLSLFFFYSLYALFIIIFDNDDIVKEQVMVKGEQKRT
jgi:hypothetical protein